ncbi:MAG: GAF domain-containing protein [Gammaproteobacteria bacterium]|nr:GAF domain-containing protein [Gammaproteobacteria bacterium]MDH3768383.1 GAF domain-containing protein [Gammaproteobacteria bacterium]
MTDDFYDSLASEARALLEGESDAIANAANLSALLYQRLPEINWAGFYFLRDGELVVGPFNGKPACTRITLGQGVCGTAIATRQTQRVADVHKIDNHIVCDADSRSEIVVPLFTETQDLGVLDIDSPLTNRFDAMDQNGLERIAAIYLDAYTRRGQ